MITRASILLNRLYAPGAALLLVGRVVQLVNSLALSVVIVRRFGLEMLGTFAVGFIGIAVLTAVAPLGLASHLPRLRARHPELCFSALAIQLVSYPIFGALLYVYASLESLNASDRLTIFSVALGGLLIGTANTGMMLSIMQRKFHPGVLGPLCESAGILVGSIMATSGFALAVYLLIGRFLATITIWSNFQFRRISIRRLSCIARRSIGYAIPDLLALLSEQCAPLLLSWLVSRSELGLFRLCQQLLTAADTPGWTFVQSKYPDLVGGDSDSSEKIHLQVCRLGWVASMLCLAGSTFLAYYIYRIPTLAYMMSLLSFTLFWRYKNNFFEQRFRASGQLGTTTVLAIFKFAISFTLFFVFIKLYGVWGAVLTLTLLSVSSGITYERVFWNQAVPAEAS